MIIRHAELQVGKVYKNRGGSEYLCLGQIGGSAWDMLNIKSSWRLTAHIITMYEDGTIEWDYSSDGYFSNFKYIGGQRQ